ncbi:MAG: hypothetical protein U1A78_27175 [Polyangia bacterium]
MRGALLIAALLHAAFLLIAYLRPPPPSKKRGQRIVMEVVTKPPPPEVQPPPPPPPPPTPPPATPQPATPQPAARRPLPRELQPVERTTPSEPGSSAIVVPPQPPQPPVEPGGPQPKGPVNLFDRGTLGKSLGLTGYAGNAPKGEDRMIKDSRLDEKKAPDFELVPEKGGGFKCETRNFIAHIKPDGGLEFENRFPIGFNKGGTFSFDLTDLAMRGAKQDPYYAEKRRFMDFSEKVRTDLRKKAIQERNENALSSLSQQLHSLWNSGRPASERRRELFEKWSECTDDKDDTLGRKGRRTIEDFIRTYLPAGSPEAFTSDELSRFAGERQGQPPFDPYRTGIR